MKRILFIVGKTSSGKDTVAGYLADKYGISGVCSNTTRPKREYEKDGVEHYFVTQEEMDKLKSDPEMIAYTKFPLTGYEYCATAKQLPDGKVFTYIIDPAGIEYFRENCSAKIEWVSIYVDLSEELIVERSGVRGDKKAELETRLEGERESFDTYKRNCLWDYLIDNSGSVDDLKDLVDNIMHTLGIKTLMEMK